MLFTDLKVLTITITCEGVHFCKAASAGLQKMYTFTCLFIIFRKEASAALQKMHTFMGDI